MLKQEIEIINKLGLHARASAKLTQTAGRFAADVFVSKAGRRVNAKSIMGVMMLAAGKGTKIELETNGADEAEAMAAVVSLINDMFGEGE
jgi:phosphocarrier protein HPr